MGDIAKILESGGFKVVTGAAAVLAAINECSDGSDEKLCSGFRVFPDGEKCPGCEDCKREGIDNESTANKRP